MQKIEAQDLIKTFCSSNGNLKANSANVKLFNSYIKTFRSVLGAESHLDVKSLMYYILHDIEPHRCKTCDKQLNIQRFASGKRNEFCSQECVRNYRPDEEELYTDYISLLDKTGNPNDRKIKNCLNEKSIIYLKTISGIETDDVKTLLYSVLKDKSKIRYCKECGSVIKIQSFTEVTPYKEEKIFCSFKCRNKNEDFKTKMKLLNQTRVQSEDYKINVGIPWFESKVQKIKQEQNISMLDIYEDIIKVARQSSYFRFHCDKCAHEFRARFIYTPICKKCNPKSRPQWELAEYIKCLGFEILYDDWSILKNYELDIVIPNKKIAIEYDGLYYHRDKNDIHKYDQCKKLGIRLIKIYDDEDAQIVRSRLAAILGKSKQRIFGRKCKVVHLSNEVYSKFMETNHIQGKIGGSKKYGLVFDSKLIAAMSFGKCRYNKDYGWELLRYASALDTTVVGGASKLFSHFVNENNPDSIVSYCDVRWGTGDMYEKLGFKFLHKTPYNYYYFKNKRESRVKYQKHKLPKIFPGVDMSKSEEEIMIEQGFSKIYDFGNFVFGWNK